MIQPLNFSEKNYHLLNEGELVFLDAEGRYRNVLDSDYTVKDSGIVDGINLAHYNRLAILITYSMGEGYCRGFPQLFLKSEVEREKKIEQAKEAEAKEERLVRLRAMRKVQERIGTDVDSLVEIEIEGITICNWLDEINPIYEVEEMSGYHQSFWGSYPTNKTIKKLKPRIF